MNSNKNTIILCGGTGGHFLPGLTIAREIRGNGGDVKLLLSGKNSEKQSETAAFHSIESAILPNLPAPVGFSGKLKFMAVLLGAWLKARRLLKRERPDSVLAMGSFTSLPAALAAVYLGIPLYLHDGNARIGKANRFLSRFASTLFMSYPIVNAAAVKCPTALTGMPTRPELDPKKWKEKTQKDILKEFNAEFATDFVSDAPTLLIFGGSQGAATFNKKMPDIIRELNISGTQIVHLAGHGHAEDTRKRYEGADFKSIVLDASTKMGLLFSIADCVVCRSGGSTIAELALFAKFAVLIPFPFASEGHQADNAAYHLSSDAAIKFNDDQVGSPEFEDAIQNILSDPAKYAELGLESAKLAKPAAAALVAENVT